MKNARPIEIHPESLLKFVRRQQGYRAIYLCRCGREKSLRISDVKRGSVKSCGCIRGRGHLKLVEGLPSTKHPLYTTWCKMVDRVDSDDPKRVRSYKSRGILVCDRWRESFKAFVEDMGPKPGPEYSIDRIDNNGHYEPGNCRWATMDEQLQNRRQPTKDPVTGAWRRSEDV